MRAKHVVWLLVAACVVYLALIAQRAWVLLTSGEPVAAVMGVALLAVPVVGGYVVGREVQFGVQAQDLARRLEAEGGLPTEQLPLRPSGRPDRTAADGLFERYRAAVQEAPDDWRPWYRLGLVYEAAGDRRRARAAVRTALRLVCRPDAR